MTADKHNTDEVAKKLYIERVESLKAALVQLDHHTKSKLKNKQLEQDMYEQGMGAILKLNSIVIFDDRKSIDHISAKEAISLLEEMTRITENYLKTKENQSSYSAVKIKDQVEAIQGQCLVLGKHTDKIFKNKKRSDNIKKAVGSIMLFLSVAVLLASILMLVAVTKGAALSIFVPGAILKLSTLTTIIGAVILSGGVSKKAYHRVGHFAKAGERAAEALGEHGTAKHKSLKHH